jgi:hypothetical protein
MLEYNMFPYVNCPGPLETANKAFGWDLMLILYMPFNLLASLIAFIATIVMAGPLLGARRPVLVTLCNFNFKNPLKFADPLARGVFEGPICVSALHESQPLW